jgi:predicted PurR-regulated permease PerM
METIIKFVKKPLVRRLLILAAIAFVLYLMRSMITLFLLTFIFIYLINAAQKYIYRHIHNFIPVNRSFIIVFIYCVIIALIVFILWLYIPQIVAQTIDVVKRISKSGTDLLNQGSTGNVILDALLDKLRNVDWESYIASGSKVVMSYIGNIGTLGFDFVLSIILSMFFLLQKSRIAVFMRSFRTSKVSWLYEEISYFGVKFSNTFGKVLQTQILISFINCLLSIVMLWIMRFPSVLGLGVMIFILGLVPVAGVFISLIPLSIIAYSVGGLKSIVYVLIMIVILHTLESYVLNPKLMSEKTNLPIFFTFLVLIVSSHFFGIWGLLVGIPVFVFFLDILDVKIVDIKRPLPTASKIKSKLKNNASKQ